ncbi:MAG: hypothetical protein QM504_05410 [Pseudomonadota bacterium]
MSSPKLEVAIKKANRLADRNDKEYFVVFGKGDYCMEYSIADQYLLDTSYAGIHRNNILYSTLNDG